MKKHNLLVSKNERLRAKRGHYRSKPKANRINQYWGMDMTKIRFPSGWSYLHIVKDWCSKEIVGWHLSYTSTTDDWLEALDRAINNKFPVGIKDAEQIPKLITDNGCQPTSGKFIQSCGALGIEQIFTSFNNPKGNADTERVMLTIKEDIVWPYDWQCPVAFEERFKTWIDDYNNDYPHMALGWKTPAQFANDTLLKVA